METLTKNTIKTSRGFTYTYYASTSSGGKQTLMLLHGWPDHAEMWEDLATKHLIPAGYGVVIPDCLGYDGTDKPTDPKEYNPVGMMNDFSEILDAEKIDKVIITGHDWGAGLAARFYIFKPERCLGMITMKLSWHREHVFQFMAILSG